MDEVNRLEIKELTKNYGKGNHPALKDFNYTFNNGIYGLLGPNGAGKSTLINLITGSLRPNAGEVLFEGQNIRELGKAFREKIGIVPQQQKLYENYSVKRFLFYFASLKGIDKRTAKGRITELLTLVNLYDKANEQLQYLSGGMKQRVLLAQAMLNDPEILILDEPTAGLDPQERMNIRNYLYSIAGHKTILIATHVIQDIEQIAKEIIFLKCGEIALSGTQDEIFRKVGNRFFETLTTREKLAELTERFPCSRIIGERNGKVLLKIMQEEKPELPEVAEAAVNLEDIYMYIFQKK